LKTRAENLVDVYLSGKERKKLSSIKDMTETEEKEVLKRFLKDYFESDDEVLSPQQLIEKYHDEIADLAKYDNDTKDIF